MQHGAALPSPAIAEVKAAVRPHVPLLLVLVAALYVLFAILHATLMPDPARLVMAPLAAASAVCLIAYALHLRVRPRDPASHALVWTLVVVLANSVAHLAVTGEPKHSTNLAVAIFAGGIVLLRWQSYAAMLATVAPVWMTIAVICAHTGDWVHYGIHVLEAAFLGGIVMALKHATLSRMFRARDRERAARIAAQAAAAEVAEAAKRAEAERAAKSNFLATMSHELRTPLNAIIGFSDLLRAEERFRQDPVVVGDYAGHINTAGRHLLGLINQVLEFSRADSGRLTLNEEPVVLDAIAQDVVAMIEPMAAAKTISIASDPCAATLMADPMALRQILINLLSNAVKFTPDGGRVTLAAWVGSEGVTLCVTDTGIGLAPDDLERVFDPFFRGERSRNRDTGGMGLGLASARATARAHGGDITLYRREGGGLCATATLPL